jgi:hypothetical protein
MTDAGGMHGMHACIYLCVYVKCEFEMRVYYSTTVHHKQYICSCTRTRTRTLARTVLQYLRRSISDVAC